MFGPGFEDHWYAVPGAPGLELSGSLQFRGPNGPRRLRHDHRGRPYVDAPRARARANGPPGDPWPHRVQLHRAVMAVLLDRRPRPEEMVCHRDDDKLNNLPDNLYIGDAHTNAADRLRNGRCPTGERHPHAKLSIAQVREIRRALAHGASVTELARAYGVHKTTVSRIKHRVRWARDGILRHPL